MIPQDFIDDLIARTDIVDLIDQYVPLKKSGANYMACCPFHKEKSPSFSVSPSKQFYHCFSCGEHGSAIAFVMKYQGLGFVEAVQLLADRVGMVVPNVRGNNEDSAAHRAAKKQQQQTLENTVQAACEFYHQQLPLNSQAIDYTNKRGLTSDIITHYGIGYAPDGWQPLAQIFQPYPSVSLVESGMVLDNEGKHYDRFRHRLMFPIRNVSGQVIGFGGRVLDDSKPKYLNSPDTPLFDKGKNLYGLYEARQAIKDAGRILVVEGYMDVVALAQFGVGYAVAALGTATTAEHIKILFRQTDSVYFCFDGDGAGRKAAWRALENALPQLKDDKSLNFLFLPENHDPDSFVRAFGRKRFEEALLHESKPLSVYFWDALTENVDISHQEGKAELVKSAAPLLNQMTQAPALAYLLKQELSTKTGIDPSNLAYLMGQAAPRRHVEAKSYQLPPESFRQPETLTLVQKQIRALLLNPQWAQYVVFPDYLPLSGDLNALLALAKFYQNHQHNLYMGTAQALEFFRNTPYANVLAFVFRHITDWDDNSDAAQQDFIDGIIKLSQQLKNEQIEQLKQKGNLNAQEMKLLMQLITMR
ncbi:DNA primase [Simonsiella muelleri]|uniref:DNA primase n=1 Tax=Simonsiella muelleri ATCC 29453 TaxID=641147 RepID=V9HMA2_9NEIS|nr:DNA primase [Simonsiella muelleri]AUX60662.1 DNA primase [Simonsiella muelleri ATCC 29453]EFG31786.1 DNA primase [Simonsiella muelleri ATCC 29453]UBQ54516.1 DNA primase [Simonsiella muelleri]